ncbi:hypothetical protein P4393_12090 [Bacillus subtilis]|nr:hypothetical protein [Bacillus subtilis]MED3474734.1 hypothetical protein [Bacillus subtilis]
MLKHLEQLITLEDFDYITNEEFKALTGLENKSYKDSLKENDIEFFEDHTFSKVLCDFISTAIHTFLYENNFFSDEELSCDEPISAYDSEEVEKKIESEMTTVFERDNKEYYFFVELSVSLEEISDNKSFEKVLSRIEDQILTNYL